MKDRTTIIMLTAMSILNSLSILALAKQVKQKGK